MKTITATSIEQLISNGATVYTNKYLSRTHLVIRFKECVELNGVIGTKFATGGLLRNNFRLITLNK